MISLSALFYIKITLMCINSQKYFLRLRLRHPLHGQSACDSAIVYVGSCGSCDHKKLNRYHDEREPPLDLAVMPPA